MTKETEKLFSAPWVIDGCEIHDSEGLLISSSDCIADAVRVACLPELYDALFEITLERCAKCVATHANRGIHAPLGFDFFTGECPFETDKYYDGDPCVWRQRWKLLGKVRDGK